MLSEDKFKLSTLDKVDKSNSVLHNKVSHQSGSNFFYPEQTDQLFWCYYIIKNDFKLYEYPGNTSFTNEKIEKFKCIEQLRLKKDILKNKKIKNVKEDIEDELANKQKIGQKTFIALCSIENINVLYIDKNKYFDMTCDNTKPYHVVHCINGKYCYELELTKEKIDKYISTLFKCDNFEKPLKAFSSYNLSELVDICKHMGLINTDNKKQKKELYTMLLEII